MVMFKIFILICIFLLFCETFLFWKQYSEEKRKVKEKEMFILKMCNFNPRIEKFSSSHVEKEIDENLVLEHLKLTNLYNLEE